MSIVKLRPIVHATRLADGVHLRGWSSSVTVRGGAGLWRIWEILSAKLAAGIPADQVSAPEGKPEIVRAVTGLLTSLREHDMLVEVPETFTAPPAIANWLLAVADDPADAWGRLSSATVTVTGAGDLRKAAVRALVDAGVSVAEADGPDMLAWQAYAVGLRVRGETGFVTPVVPRGELSGVTGIIGTRLSAVDGPTPWVLSALTGGAAAHRLVCAIAGLPDPAHEAALVSDSAGVRPEHPTAIVTRLDPLRVSHHPVLLGGSVDQPATVADILTRLDVLTDPVLGPVPEPAAGTLPQQPAALARAGDLVGFGATTDAARLDAALRWTAYRLCPDGTFVVGVNDTHARGQALRLRALALPAAEPVADAEWASNPAARRWWKALTLRFGVPATLTVDRLAAGAVRAVVTVDGTVVAHAVEAEAADAVGFAALAATGVAQSGVDTGWPVLLTGALSYWEPEGEVTTPWSDGWSWPAGVVRHEEDLQAVLTDLVGPPPVVRGDDDLPQALAAVGFAVAEWARTTVGSAS
ncbi:hypothetical protein [Hamadaea tsunoensis]|uniref:hypothetical protein n=1 Tax=Hamadaea tsunoensis TaxID=53368 RepID=UPI00040DBBE9|nr:hypothetical protein [Hamadaea tsunoensis]